MKDIDFFSNISIGQYLEIKSPIHALSPSTKYGLLGSIVFLILASPTSLGVLMGILIVIILEIISRLSTAIMFRSLNALPALGLLSFFLQFIFNWPGDHSAYVLSIGIFHLSWYEFSIVVSILARAAGMIMAMGWFTSVITEHEAADEIDWIIRRLFRKSSIAHKASLIVAATLRFVPIIAGELEDIAKAQASRGATFGTKTRNPIQKARNYLPLFVPVTIRALEKAEMLAEAMEARCYTGESVREPPSPSSITEKLLAVGIAALVVAIWFADYFIARPWIRP